MTDARSRKVSLAGQVVEDLTYAPLDAARYAVELIGSNRAPFYKSGGFFAFSDVYPGQYTLRISGERFQSQQYTVTVPFAPLVFEQPGDNELVVVVKTLADGQGNPPNRITFDPVFLKRGIRAGARVLAQNLTTKLAADLDVGKVASARLESVAGLAAGSIVRIVRDKSIRLRFDPYSPSLVGLTSAVGRVTTPLPVPGRPLEGATVRVVKINDVDVVLTNIGGVKVATVQLGQTKIILGSEKDLTTLTNDKGDYGLYFSREGLQSVTLRATLATYQPLNKRLTLVEKGRNRADFQLQKVTT